MKSIYSDLIEEFGVPNSTLWNTLNVIFPPLTFSSLKHQFYLVGVCKITNRTIIEVITITVVKKITGTKNCLIKDKEAYIVATSEMDGAYRLPGYAIILAKKIQHVLHGVFKLSIGK